MSFRRLLALLNAVLFFGTLVATAQISYSFRPDGPDYLAPGAPFTVRRVTRQETRLQDGSTMQHEVRELLSRDAQGRLFDDVTFVPANALQTPLQQLTLADPVSGTISDWRLGASSGMTMQLPQGKHLSVSVLQGKTAPMKPVNNKMVTTEQLGQEEIAGQEATGTRTTTIVPANLIGNPDPLRIVHEVWMSDDLHIPLRELDINPVTGTRTMTTEKIELNAGRMALFHLPPGITFTTRNVGLADVAAKIAFAKAMNDIKAPETRETAADFLVHYAETHKEDANHVAHTLAIRNTHLDDAKRLGTESVQRMEQATTDLSLDAEALDSFREMFDLAEYWDSLGSVYAALGDSETAERYFRDAWSLGGEGLYLDHIAVMQEHAGDKPGALQTLRVALSGKMDERETDQVKRRADRLGGQDLQALPQPTIVDVPGAKKQDASADFLLLFSGAGAPAVQFVSGDEALKADAKQVAAAAFPSQLPDSGPERVLRRGHLQCSAADGCRLTLLYAWQAEDAVHAGLRSVALGGPPE